MQKKREKQERGCGFKKANLAHRYGQATERKIYMARGIEGIVGERKFLTWCSGVVASGVEAPKRYVPVLIPGSCEYNLMKKKHLADVKKLRILR